MDNQNSGTDNILVFPGARIEQTIGNKGSNKIQNGLTDKEIDEGDFEFSIIQPNDNDPGYTFAFKNHPSLDIENLYHRPRISLDFTLPVEIQSALKTLEVQFNQWDYLIRKISYYSR